MRSILAALGVGSLAMISACTLIVDEQLASKAGEPDAGPTGPHCDSTQQCLMLADQLFNCSLECVDQVCVETAAGTPDGTICGGSGGSQICVGATCVMRECGDGYVDRTPFAMPIAEYCDDGNTNDSDGCNDMCTRSCVAPAPQCGDDNPCNGEETCVSAMGLCRAMRAPDEGSACTTGDGLAGTCQRGSCVAD